MTEALLRFVEDVLRKQAPDYEPVGVGMSAMQAEIWLRAFVQEVSNRADKCTFSEHLTKEGCVPIMNCLQLAYDGLVRELGLDGEGER